MEYPSPEPVPDEDAGLVPVSPPFCARLCRFPCSKLRFMPCRFPRPELHCVRCRFLRSTLHFVRVLLAVPVLLPEAAFCPEPAPLATVPGLPLPLWEPLGDCPGAIGVPPVVVRSGVGQGDGDASFLQTAIGEGHDSSGRRLEQTL